jgi:hypothetical protein
MCVYTYMCFLAQVVVSLLFYLTGDLGAILIAVYINMLN